MKKVVFVATLVCAALVTALPAQADFFQGFETDTTGWFGSVTRVPSGTNSVTSADGSFHANITGTPYTQFGGYNYEAGGGVPTAFQEYTTSIDIFLDVDAGWGNDTRFDFSSAINNSSGNFLRDFIFNVGFYNDATGPGANTNRFVISASNNSQPGSAYAKNPDKDPIAISTSGWYTFEHHFYENAGELAVDMSIYDSAGTLVNTWTMDPNDLIANVGGNRYGWFDYNQFSVLSIDNSSLTVAPVPEPATMTLLGLGLGGLLLQARRRKQS